jgi:hypothetical protein
MTPAELMDLATKNYDNGGHIVVECYEADELLSLGIHDAESLKKFCQLMVERHNDTSFGDEEAQQFEWAD